MLRKKTVLKFLPIISWILFIFFSFGMTALNPSSNSKSSRHYDSSRNNFQKKQAVKSDSGKTAGEFFKNIKVLKNIPADRLIPTMHFIEAGVGMNCGNCHVRDNEKGWEFDKDTKPEKRKARKMIEMMNAINNNSFKGHQEVTCYTCHRGEPDPQKIPDVQTLASLQEFKAKEKLDDNIINVPNRLNTPADIINKYVSKIGGKKSFKKLKALKYEGTIISNGKSASIMILKKAPDQYSYSVKTEKGEMTEGYNGKTAWEKAGWGSRELKGDDLEEIKLEADFYTPIEMDKIYSNLKLDDVSVIDGDTVYVVEGKASEHRFIKLYFSTKTGLLVRQVILNNTPLGNLPAETDFKDYRKVNGIMMPFEIHRANYENVEDIKFDRITVNIPLEENVFNIPAKK